MLSTAYVTACWGFYFSGCLFYILQSLHFSTLSVLCFCFQPNYFFLRLLLHFSKPLCFIHLLRRIFKQDFQGISRRGRCGLLIPQSCTKKGKKSVPSDSLETWHLLNANCYPHFSYAQVDCSFLFHLLFAPFCSVLVNTKRNQELLAVQTDEFSPKLWIVQAFKSLQPEQTLT